MIFNWSQSGFTECAVRWDWRDSVLTFFVVDTSEFLSATRPQERDTILRIGDSVAIPGT